MSALTSEVFQAFAQLIESAAGSYPIAWPDVNFTPPGSGAWVEVIHFPAPSEDYGISYADSAIESGQMVIQCYDRPNNGTTSLTLVAESFISAMPRGTPIVSDIRVHRQPYDEPPIISDDRTLIQVIIPYSS